MEITEMWDIKHEWNFKLQWSISRFFHQRKGAKTWYVMNSAGAVIHKRERGRCGSTGWSKSITIWWWWGCCQKMVARVVKQHKAICQVLTCWQEHTFSAYLAGERPAGVSKSTLKVRRSLVSVLLCEGFTAPDHDSSQRMSTIMVCLSEKRWQSLDESSRVLRGTTVTRMMASKRGRVSDGGGGPRSINFKVRGEAEEEGEEEEEPGDRLHTSWHDGKWLIINRRLYLNHASFFDYTCCSWGFAVGRILRPQVLNHTCALPR